MSTEFQPASSHVRSLQKYRRKAKIYDSTTDGTNTIRDRTIRRLNLQPGDIVLDVGCGSGVSFAPLMRAIGVGGSILGIDQSPEMLAIAQRKCVQNGWTNVHLQNTFAESVQLPLRPTAILFHYTHDILQSPQAVRNLLAQAEPGARISIAGMKNFAWWTGPLTLLSFFKNFAWNGNPRGLWRPWRHIEPYLGNYRWQSTQWGMGYMASGLLLGVSGKGHAGQQADDRA